jgi:hypothetical protein
MSACQHCGSRANDAFLCRQCATDLREMLEGLPRWLAYLSDAAHGQTRLGESARRSGDLTSPMPVHLGASALYRQVHNTLSRIMQEICESRGVEIPR